MNINFSEIPNHQNLFLNYLYEFENVKSFYRYDFRKKEDYPDIFKKIISRVNPNRDEVKNIIKQQYSDFQNISQKTSRNIELINDRQTLFVITGQQLGILGGPLYTFYKIITTIKLATHLNERYEKFNFVPLFWMESDDHDFNEINSINLLNDANDLITLFYKADIEEEETKNSVGSIVLDDSINQLFSNLESELRNSEFKTSLIDKLRKYYSPGKKIKRSFFELLFDIFDKHGLIIFDPQNDKIKNLLKPIFIKELNDFREHTKKLVSVSAELEGKYHAQVKIKPINLFYNLDNGRYSIEPDENIFKLRRKRKQFSFDELISEVENHPEKFSPNVLLRPITQEYLFNTAFYVAGPSEIAYFAQINPLYEFFNLIPPIIYPRASTTLLEKHLMNFIEKYDLEIKDIFYGQEHLKEKIFSRISELDLNAIFDDNIEKINQIFDQLKQELFRVDKTLSDSVNKYRDRNVLLINELKSKSKKYQDAKYDTVLRQLNKLSNLLYPNENLQERELNFIYFVNKFGFNLIDKIYEEISIQEFSHQVIYL